MTTVAGSVDRIVFRNSDTGFCVARFRLADASRDAGVTTIVGTLPSIQTGEMLRLEGEWQLHPVHGRNFRVETFEQHMPTTADGIERYLSSGVIRGVGPVTASRIVACFGEGSISVIDEEPEKLRGIAGISQRRLDIIKRAWEEQKKIRNLMMFLQDHAISVALASRIFQAYGDDAADVITRDPYRLARDIHGVGFRTADSVARLLGISKNSVSRLVAGLRHTLSDATDDGHVFVSRSDTLSGAARLLDAQQSELEPALLELLRQGDAVLEGENVYLTPFFRAEAGAARLVRELLRTPSGLTLDPRFNPGEAIERAAAAQGLVLADKQLQAAEQALREKVSILTGGPGTGKTSTLRTVITALEESQISYCLCAPTGRAAKRVAETTGRPASTIHRLLQFQPSANVFNYDRSRPLVCDFVIVDEVSMLDALLFYHLLKAIPSESHLLLVGDADQLPAVGPGNVLRDLINSQVIRTVTLTDLFRQARGSQIILAAHKVNHGQVPQIDNQSGQDLFFVRTADEAAAVQAIKRLLKDRIPERFHFHPVDDIQVVSPMHDGPAGVTALNIELQALLNPTRHGVSEIQRGGRVFRQGDKVMQIRNNYDKDVYNGDVGKVTRVLSEELRLIATFPTGSGSLEIEYEFSELEELVLAYATSVHKAQGSEYPCVVMPLVNRHFMLLQRNLLYTAITRARQLCVLVGSPKALATAVGRDRRESRNTRLSFRLRNPSESSAQLELA